MKKTAIDCTSKASEFKFVRRVSLIFKNYETNVSFKIKLRTPFQLKLTGIFEANISLVILFQPSQ